MAGGLGLAAGPRRRRLDGVNTGDLMNTIKPSMCGGDAAFLSNYFDHLSSLISSHRTFNAFLPALIYLCMAIWHCRYDNPVIRSRTAVIEKNSQFICIKV